MGLGARSQEHATGSSPKVRMDIYHWQVFLMFLFYILTKFPGLSVKTARGIVMIVSGFYSEKLIALFQS